MAKSRTNKAELHMRLYVSGNALNSVRAIANITTICTLHFAGKYDLEIVDMMDNPRRALADEIVVTPTLLKLFPSPEARVIGDLADTDQVLMVLTGV